MNAKLVLFATIGMIASASGSDGERGIHGAGVSMPGGWGTAAASSKEVQDAAAFAVAAQAKAEGNSKGGKPLELVKVVEATQQVVAGMNYKLRLNVKQDGMERSAEAVVYRKLSGAYELTSWTWK
jgi:hypothetical protein